MKAQTGPLVLPLLVIYVFTATPELLAAEPSPEKPDEPAWPQATPEAINAWPDDRFGMFVCRGPVTLTAPASGRCRGPPPGRRLRRPRGTGGAARQPAERGSRGRRRMGS